MSSRNSICTIFRAACLTVMGMLPISAFADSPMVFDELKHDLSRPLRDITLQAEALTGARESRHSSLTLASEERPL
jgi:hypothetical protein